jgi:hypothetical protein
MKIEIDTKVLNLNKLTPNGYVTLYLLHSGTNHKVGPITKEKLTKLGFLDTEGLLTKKANDLFKVDLKQLNDEKIKEFLVKLRDLFPKGVKTGGSPVRSAIGVSTIRKFKNFLKEYGYSKDIIIKATQAYVLDRKKNNYGYMKKFTNFIDKQGEGSLLATFCETIENGEEKQNTTTRIERTL